MNLHILLLDRRGRVLWALGVSQEVIGQALVDLAFDEDRAMVGENLARCVVKGEAAEFVARWQCSPKDAAGWALTSLHPVEPQPTILSVAALSISSLLPANYMEFNEADRELLGLLADDHNIKDAATTVDRSESAIDNRIRSLKTKMGKHTLHGLVAGAIRGQLVPMSPPHFSLTEAPGESRKSSSSPASSLP